jgi:hypothetical protein
MFTRVLPVTFLCFASLAVFAQDNRPATFDYDESDKQLQNLISFPKEVTGKVELILSCVSRIQPNGKMDETGCYQMNQYEQAFASQVIRAARKARMRPAIIDGKAREIYLQFRVEFIREKALPKKADDEKGKKKKKEEEQEIVDVGRALHLYLNPGYEENVLEYGYEHIAGQRVIGKEPWQDICPSRAKYTLWVRAFLSEEGEAASPTIEFGNGIRPVSNCLEAIKDTIITSQYAPAMAEGVPVPSTYIELFGN